ncbi:hypothetical protein [Borrelia miyamotoi]|uniref:Uncharacterized protein n=1 Tax=Borrelia miyamotoi TaxID=47466 RepID=A0AAQ2WXM6_9SPIR|nr:hypothetical protein [Borrelia miyamotoi]AJA67239.1 hypothetical protein I871_B13 [Borrelia miyamotoi LB-2001]AOW96318.1 hypothetical protein AXH25_04620 [Borrelia miyamotoi]QTL84142.1 hypothetical protein bmLB2001_001118 [Borrelia miyamotoi]WAZ85792.1 hypothetical protein O5400_05435 [Borrelia miyamotoi]WAZ91574.1 hypothetical protein O5398_05420 [Borrelia miyamotoi]
MNTGFLYFFKRVLNTNDSRMIYISYLYDNLVSIEPMQDWLKIDFRDSRRGKKYFFLFKRSKLNGNFISCNFLRTEVNYGLDIKFSDGNINVFCKDRKSLEFLKFRVEHFFQSSLGVFRFENKNNSKEKNSKMKIFKGKSSKNISNKN